MDPKQQKIKESKIEWLNEWKNILLQNQITYTVQMKLGRMMGNGRQRSESTQYEEGYQENEQYGCSFSQAWVSCHFSERLMEHGGQFNAQLSWSWYSVLPSIISTQIPLFRLHICPDSAIYSCKRYTWWIIYLYYIIWKFIFV